MKRRTFTPNAPKPILKGSKKEVLYPFELPRFTFLPNTPHKTEGWLSRCPQLVGP